MRALIYGHSQSEGMGLDLERLLKQRGLQVTRLTKRGYNDRRLVQNVAEVPPGPYDRVYLYAGGNSDAPSVNTIKELVNLFGVDRSVVILAPANRDNPERYSISRAKIEGNTAGLRGFVRVYAVEAGGAEFYPDKIHMKPGTPTSRQLAAQIVAETVDGAPAPSEAPSAAPRALLFVGLGALAFWLWRRR